MNWLLWGRSSLHSSMQDKNLRVIWIGLNLEVVKKSNPPIHSQSLFCEISLGRNLDKIRSESSENSLAILKEEINFWGSPKMDILPLPLTTKNVKNVSNSANTIKCKILKNAIRVMSLKRIPPRIRLDPKTYSLKLNTVVECRCFLPTIWSKSLWIFMHPSRRRRAIRDSFKAWSCGVRDA